MAQYKFEGKPSTLQTGIQQVGYKGSSLIKALDLSQSRHFTVELSGIQVPPNLVGNNPLDQIDYNLPVRNITYTMAGLDISTFSIGVFRDLPLPTGIRLPKISLTLLDTSTDSLEVQFRNWYRSMVPSNGYVAYLSSIVKTLTYTSYNFDGSINEELRLPVVLADDITMTRDYEANDFKTFEVNLVVLSNVHNDR